jgi:hypothetical protein
MITWKVAPIGKVLTHLENQIAGGHRYGDDYNLSQTHGRIYDLQQAGLTEFPVPVEDGGVDYGLLDRLSKGEDGGSDGRQHVRTPETDRIAEQVRKRALHRDR